jgi:hypothetical protein
LKLNDLPLTDILDSGVSVLLSLFDVEIRSSIHILSIPPTGGADNPAPWERSVPMASLATARIHLDHAAEAR